MLSAPQIPHNLSKIFHLNNFSRKLSLEITNAKSEEGSTQGLECQREVVWGEKASVVQAILSDRSIGFGCCLQECQDATDWLSAGLWLLFLMQSYKLSTDSVILNAELVCDRPPTSSGTEEHFAKVVGSGNKGFALTLSVSRGFMLADTTGAATWCSTNLESYKQGILEQSWVFPGQSKPVEGILIYLNQQYAFKLKCGLYLIWFWYIIQNSRMLTILPWPHRIIP